MIPYTAIVTVIGFTISLFLATTYQGFNNYHQIEAITRGYNTSTIAAASSTARSASNLLSTLAISLASDSATGTAEIASRYAALQKYFNDIDTLTATNNPSVLVSTVTKGFDYSSTKKIHSAYSVDLIQSAYLPAQAAAADKRYAQTLITDDHVAKVLTVNNLRSDFDAGNSKIRISSRLLSALVSNPSPILADPAAYGLEINDRGLDLATIPNGVRLSLQVPLSKLALASAKTKPEGEKLVQRNAVAQIRFKSSTLTVIPCLLPKVIINGVCQDPSPPSPPPSCLPPKEIINGVCQERASTCPLGWEWNALKRECEKSIPAIDLMLQAIPNNKVGIVFNPNLPLSATNPIEIINKKTGGFNSIYKESDGDLHISIGAVPTKANGITNFGKPPKVLEGNFEVSATLFDINEGDEVGPGLVLGGSGATGATISLDTLPRIKTRYGTVSSTFKFNGRLVTAGSVVVGVRKPGLSTKARPDPKDGEFESYRIYSREGVFLGQFGSQFGIDNASKLKFNYTVPGTTIEDPRFGTVPVYQDFSTSDLFKSKSSFLAMSAWLRMQADLAANTQMNILSRQSSWQTRIFDQIYETGLLDFQASGAKKIDLNELTYLTDVYSIEGNLAAFNAVYPDPVSLVNANVKALFDSRFNAASRYAKAVLILKLIQDDQIESNSVAWGGDTSHIPDLNTAKAELAAAKKALDAARAAYDQATQSGNNSANSSSTTTSVSTNSAGGSRSGTSSGGQGSSSSNASNNSNSSANNNASNNNSNNKNNNNNVGKKNSTPVGGGLGGNSSSSSGGKKKK